MSFIEMDFASGGTPKEGTPDFYQEFVTDFTNGTLFELGFEPSKIIIYTKWSNAYKECCFWGKGDNNALDSIMNASGVTAYKVNTTTYTTSVPQCYINGSQVKYKPRASYYNNLEAVIMAWK